jgi:Large eukaryotic DNA virus major capsid protein
LPLVALSRHPVKVTVEFETAANLIKMSVPGSVGNVSIPNAVLLVDYIFLDVEERRQFARMPHEYLVETVQYVGIETSNQTNYQQKLSLNHPITELISICQLVSEKQALNWNNFANSSQDGDNLLFYKLQVNSQDYETGQEGRYFQLVVPYKCHTNGPRKGLYVKSFSLSPEGQQPAGSINGSRVDTFNLQLQLASSNPTDIMTFGLNKNIFRVMSSSGGLLYSN